MSLIDCGFVALELVNKMVLFWIPLVLALSGSNAEGEFGILHSPDSLIFKPKGATVESTLKEIFAAALGLSVYNDAEWEGLYIMDPFNTPEAAVDVHIDGISAISEHIALKAEIFPLLVDEDEPDTFEGVKLRIKQRFDVGGNEIVNFKLSEATKFSNMKTVFGKVDGASYSSKMNQGELKHTVMEDGQFLSELRTLRAVIEKVKDGVLHSDNKIDFFNFRFRSLHTLSDYYGPFSNQTKEAMILLGDALQDLTKAFVKAYDGSVLVIVVTTEVSHASRRSARAVTVEPLGHSEKWPYQWLKQQPSQEKKSNVAQSGLRQENSDKTDRRGGSPAYSTGMLSTGANEPVSDLALTENDVITGGPEGNYDYSIIPDDDAKLARAFTYPEMSDEDKKRDENIEKVLEDKTAGLFCLFFHFGLAWYFAMLAVIYVLCEMDPGSDTIIYRLTAPRPLKGQ